MDESKKLLIALLHAAGYVQGRRRSGATEYRHKVCPHRLPAVWLRRVVVQERDKDGFSDADNAWMEWGIFESDGKE